MAKKFTRGLQSLKFAPASTDGTMPTEGLVAVDWSKEGSVTINIGEAEETKINIEEADTALRVLYGSRDVNITAEIYDTSLDSMAQFFGGEVAVSEWTPDAEMAAENQAVELTTRSDSGKAMKINIPAAAIMASMGGNLTKKDGLTIKLKITPLIVVAGTPPWTWEEV